MTHSKLTFIEHLEELRAAIIKSLVFIIAASVFVYTFTDRILSFLAGPVGHKLVFIAPQEAFIANIKVALLGGLYFSSPFVFYQAWQFVSAGLASLEKKYVLAAGFLSFILFIAGSLFGYFIIVPLGVRFLLGFATTQVVPMISVGRYISFVGMLTLAFGLVFQLPLIVLLLAKIKIITSESLSRNRKYAILVIFIIGAALTPPDLITQCLMAVPLIILYETSIFICRSFHR